MSIRLASVILLLLLAGRAGAADWREGVGAFRVGIVAGNNSAETSARLEPFRLALAESLDLNVELFVARDYSTLINALVQSRIEYAILSASAHALTQVNCECIEPLAIARDGDGAELQTQVLLARRDGPDTLSKLKGGRVGALRASAFGGFEVAVDGLRQAGLDIGGGGATLQLFDSGADLMGALAEGKVDAALGWVPGDGSNDAPVRGTLAAYGAVGGDPLTFRTIWKSVAIPNRMHSVRRNLPGETKSRLREVLSAMFSDDPVAYDSVEPDHGGGFIVARPSQIEPLIEAVRRLRGEAAPKP